MEKWEFDMINNNQYNTNTVNYNQLLAQMPNSVLFDLANKARAMGINESKIQEGLNIINSIKNSQTQV